MEMLHRRKFYSACLNIMLPGLSELEVPRHLKAIKSGAEIPISACSDSAFSIFDFDTDAIATEMQGLLVLLA